MDLSLFNVGLIVLVTLVLAFLPRILGVLGLYKLLGNSKLGIKVSEFLGSKEPTVFWRGVCVVAFFLALGILILNGVTTQAIQYAIHKPAIDSFERCENNFQATQVTFGSWIIKCSPNYEVVNSVGNYTTAWIKFERNYTGGLPNPVSPSEDIFVETTTDERGVVSKTPNNS